MLLNFYLTQVFEFFRATFHFAVIIYLSSFTEEGFALKSTLESGMHIPLRLLIYQKNSRGYSLITDLKDLNFTT